MSIAPEITGERVLLGTAGGRNEQDHIDRYTFAQPYVTDKTVLDVACGTGYGAEILAEAGAKKVLGVDNDADTIEFAKANCKYDAIEFVCASAETIPMTDKESQTVVSFETIEHLPDDVRTKYLHELHRVLSDDGVLLLSTPNKRITTPWKQKPNNPYHVLEYTHEALQAELKKHGFSILEWYGQREIFIPFTWYVVRKTISVVERITSMRFGLYDVALGRGVQVPRRGFCHRYFLVVAKKI